MHGKKDQKTAKSKSASNQEKDASKIPAQNKTCPPASSKSSRDQAANDSAHPPPEPFVSRRSKAAHKPADPLPSAPTTRVRRAARPGQARIIYRTESKAPIQSPLTRVRTFQVKEAQILGNFDGHPGDPLYAGMRRFPGTAAREVLVEETGEGTVEFQDRIASEDVKLTPVQPKEKRPVPTLEHGLDRVLFKYVTLFTALIIVPE